LTIRKERWMYDLSQETMIRMNWTQVENAARADALVLLPLGVIEEHGPHLCLGTDIYIAHLHALNVKSALEEAGRVCVIAPPFYWGVCQANAGFIGSFRIRKETVCALLYDILSSLYEFGFRRVYGINAHGDIEHAAAILHAFREAGDTLKMDARFGFPAERLGPFGLSGQEPFLFVVNPSRRSAGSGIPDVHAGDMETAILHAYVPGAVDEKRALSLLPVPLAPEMGMAWLMGGRIRELSELGYLGDPAAFPHVDVEAYMRDCTLRICEGILSVL